MGKHLLWHTVKFLLAVLDVTKLHLEQLQELIELFKQWKEELKEKPTGNLLSDLKLLFRVFKLQLSGKIDGINKALRHENNVFVKLVKFSRPLDRVPDMCDANDGLAACPELADSLELEDSPDGFYCNECQKGQYFCSCDQELRKQLSVAEELGALTSQLEQVLM
ncbi:agnoprotein [Rousettus leschenaultii polyomavirus 1]|nr:agnoprotein [Rousettus leschenaultii polyomavirus 1]